MYGHACITLPADKDRFIIDMDIHGHVYCVIVIVEFFDYIHDIGRSI